MPATITPPLDFRVQAVLARASARFALLADMLGAHGDDPPLLTSNIEILATVARDAADELDFASEAFPHSILDHGLDDKFVAARRAARLMRTAGIPIDTSSLVRRSIRSRNNR